MEWLQEESLPIEDDVFSTYCDNEITETDKELYRMVASIEDNSLSISQEDWERCLYLCTLTGNTQL